MPMLTKPIKVLIADGQTLFRQGLVSLFDSVPDIDVVGEAVDGNEVVHQTITLHPDVVIMDSLMPVMNGSSATRRIRNLHPQTEILFLASAHSEDAVRDAFESGGRGFLLKDCDLDELVYAIKKAAHGDYYISSVIGPELVDAYVKAHLKSQRPGGLMTAREHELARLLADGYSTKEAADILNISPKTAETHRASIMKKLKARNVTDIVKYCIRNHIIEI
jgi:two-component system, NarL family, response regulator NreC